MNLAYYLCVSIQVAQLCLMRFFLPPCKLILYNGIALTCVCQSLVDNWIVFYLFKSNIALGPWHVDGFWCVSTASEKGWVYKSIFSTVMVAFYLRLLLTRLCWFFVSFNSCLRTTQRCEFFVTCERNKWPRQFIDRPMLHSASISILLTSSSIINTRRV